MANKTKDTALKIIAAIAKKSAEIGSNSASVLGYHQPKEPTALKKTSK
jgi:cyclic lactone autoinducer peptide